MSFQDSGLSSQVIGLLDNNASALTQAAGAGIGTVGLPEEITLFVRVIDFSSSMRPYASDVIDAANAQLDALVASKAKGILMSTMLFNHDVELLHTYVPLDAVPRLDASNYSPIGSTALYQATLDAVSGAVQYTTQLRGTGATVTTVIVIITDGENMVMGHTSAEVRAVLDDLRRQEIYTVAYVAFGSVGQTIANELGVVGDNLLTPSADGHGIRKAMGQVSASVVGASQGVVGSNSFFSTSP